MYYEQPYQYIPGTHWQLCDECGRKIRSTESRKRWDGMVVCQKDWEPRHPQELLHEARTDRQSVRDPRPRPEVVYVAGHDIDHLTDYMKNEDGTYMLDEDGNRMEEE
jgi:hypothetical protein